MYNKCERDIIKKNLVLDIDISNISSWDGNWEYVLYSKEKWSEAISDDIVLSDFGLTAYDNGRVNSMNECLYIDKTDKIFKLYRVGTNNGINTTDYTNYEINGVIDSNIGNFFELNGGFLQGFFKLDNYNYEILPPRYPNGFTIQTLINIKEESQGIIYYMGVRSEDKYNDFFSGETEFNGEEYDGILTSYNNNLNAYLEEEILNEIIGNYEKDKYKIIKNKVKQIDNLKNNVFALELTEDKRIKIVTINNDGLLDEFYSQNKILTNGWCMITITFNPYENIPNYDKEYYRCYPDRTGELKIYINDIMFWKIDNFKEFYHRPIINDREKIIGVPYNISWGGGSFGLKHSYHFDKNNINIYNGENIVYINNNFNVSGGNFQFDNINNTMDVVVLNNNVEVLYNTPIQINGGHIYNIKCDIEIDNIFKVIDKKGFIKINILSTDNYNIIDEKFYLSKSSNNKVSLFLKVRFDKYCLNDEFSIYLQLNSNIGLNQNSILKIKNINIETTNILVQDYDKNNLMIEKYFNKPFIGDIQKLKLYNTSLNKNEILNNLFVEFNNENYNVSLNNGGRIIYR